MTEHPSPGMALSTCGYTNWCLDHHRQCLDHLERSSRSMKSSLLPSSHIPWSQLTRSKSTLKRAAKLLHAKALPWNCHEALQCDVTSLQMSTRDLPSKNGRLLCKGVDHAWCDTETAKASGINRRDPVCELWPKRRSNIILNAILVAQQPFQGLRNVDSFFRWAYPVCFHQVFFFRNVVRQCALVLKRQVCSRSGFLTSFHSSGFPCTDMLDYLSST